MQRKGERCVTVLFWFLWCHLFSVFLSLLIRLRVWMCLITEIHVCYCFWIDRMKIFLSPYGNKMKHREESCYTTDTWSKMHTFHMQSFLNCTPTCEASQMEMNREWVEMRVSFRSYFIAILHRNRRRDGECCVGKNEYYQKCWSNKCYYATKNPSFYYAKKCSASSIWCIQRFRYSRLKCVCESW